jgi:type IV secretory pathway TrbD component/type IV secretory pathway VirB2 component (pilin)
MPLNRVRHYLALAYAFACVALATSPAYAAGSNMPWEQPLNQILESVQGPVAKVVSVIIIIITGLTLAFGETSGGFRRLIQIVFGLSIAFAASSFFLSFFQWRRSAGLMDQVESIACFYAPVHRALTEPILLGGAPRSVAIVNGTLAAAVGLGLRLWLVGGAIWLIGHLAAVWAAKRDPAFVDVVRRHLRYPQHLVA